MLRQMIELKRGGTVDLSEHADAGGRSGYTMVRVNGLATKNLRPTVGLIMDRAELRELAVEVLRRLKGGDDVARIAVPGQAEPWALALDRLVDLVAGDEPSPQAKRSPTL
jgi:hypothetical protein